MHGTTTLVLANLFAFVSGHEINYCGAKMCGHTDAHTFCRFKSGPSPSCAGYIPAALTPEEKSRILARLNRRRDDAAAGRLRGLPSAGNMLRLRWVGELEKESQLWADQCRPPTTPEERDACRDLYSVNVGQCVASVVGDAPGLRVESMVDIWFMQNLLYKGNVTLYEPPEGNQRFYGDFAQMMWARTYMVGCGRSRFMVPIRGRHRTVERLVCNFAPKGPSPYRPIWTSGVPATACPARSRPYTALTSLCDYQYELNQLNDIDDSMTMEEHIILNSLLEIERNEMQYEASLDEKYLTYLAIVTMQNLQVTTPRYNSVQKRDIVEQIDTEDENSGMMGDLEEFLNATVKSQSIKTLMARNTKKKPKFMIGRPKSYNVDDLNDIDGDQKSENHDSTDRLSKLKKEFYEEYNIYTTEESAITTTELMKFEKDLNENTTHHINYNTDANMLANVTMAVLSKKTETFAFMDPLNNITNYKEIDNAISNLDSNYTGYTSIITDDKIVEDYLSDPETVRQLQEALDRMEREASTVNVSKSSGKVRRELRNIAPEQTNEDELTLVPSGLTIPESEVLTTLSPEEEQNHTMERAPMLDMVLKYMPYLKNYKSDLTLGHENSASCAYFSLGRLIVMLSLSFRHIF